MSLPLDDIRVIDFGQIYAAPYCTMQLAYLGADEIGRASCRERVCLYV